jgi:hypothetical protein
MRQSESRTARQEATGYANRAADLTEQRPGTRRESLPASTDIADSKTPSYQEANPTGDRAGAGTGLVDVLRGIAALLDSEWELLT